MVLVNYEAKLKEIIFELTTASPKKYEKVLKAARTSLFEKLVCRIYEYCEVAVAVHAGTQHHRKTTVDSQARNQEYVITGLTAVRACIQNYWNRRLRRLKTVRKNLDMRTACSCLPTPPSRQRKVSGSITRSC